MKFKFIYTTILFLFLFQFGILSAEDLKIGTFNIEWYPQFSTDSDLVWETIKNTNSDILAVEEITDISKFSNLINNKSNGKMKFITFTGNITWSQKIGFVYNSDKVEPKGDVEILPSTVYDSQGDKHSGWRPAHHIFFASKTGGFDFHIIAVHMAGPSGNESDRRTQWRSVKTILWEASVPDQDIIIIGDFNCYEGYSLFDAMTVDAGFKLITNKTPSYCYHGHFSYLDNILISENIDEEEFTSDQAIYIGGGFSADFDCNEFTSSEYYNKVSDHLPVLATFKNIDNDPDLSNDKISLFNLDYSYNGPVIGNKRSKIYHHPDSGTLPAEYNRIRFDSVSEAKATGFRAARNWDWD